MASNNGARQKRVAILIENHFEDFSFQIPHTALQKAGAKVTVLGSRLPLYSSFLREPSTVTVAPAFCSAV